jgi:hypothetical protein
MIHRRAIGVSMDSVRTEFDHPPSASGRHPAAAQFDGRPGFVER